MTTDNREQATRIYESWINDRPQFKSGIIDRVTSALGEAQPKGKDLRIYDRDGQVVTQGALNALLSELDKANVMREALRAVGCRAIPKGKVGKCDCIVCKALRGQPSS